MRRQLPEKEEKTEKSLARHGEIRYNQTIPAEPGLSDPAK